MTFWRAEAEAKWVRRAFADFVGFLFFGDMEDTEERDEEVLDEKAEITESWLDPEVFEEVTLPFDVKEELRPLFGTECSRTRSSRILCLGGKGPGRGCSGSCCV